MLRSMNPLTWTLASMLAITAFGTLDPERGWSRNTAAAIDLFGSEKEERGEEETPVFWERAKDPKPITPIGAPSTFADLAERVSPAVVNIRTQQTVTGGGHGMQSPFDEFFGGNPFHGGPSPREHKRQGEGSGFVISNDGYIVTNAHVIEDADRITVAFLDGKELDATVVGRDPKTDIALIQVETEEKLVALPLGDSEAIRPGDWVVAIGNPFGLEHTVTAGIVSAKHRMIGQGQYDDFIQTDAAINPGNSGGPLINLAGEVIGINTAINPRANTIGFTVPINMAKQILPQLRSDGFVTRGWLGVVIQGITPDLATEFGLSEEKGALVSRVLPDSPAAASGLELGDVIVDFAGTPIDDWRELPKVVAATPADRKVDLVVVRKGKKKTLQVQIGKQEEPELAHATRPQTGLAEFGLAVQDLTPEIAQQLGVEEDDGVVITDIESGSPAETAGLRRGDVIIEVDRNDVADTKVLKKKLAAADDSVLMLIRRGDATIFVPMKRAG
ncbi:MAG: DegQ family serine endoprotease [Deltaproteobacteria bacterium]|nr:DegQ family serine endoprotease [Deltaproteobacteria bacterium]